MSVHDALEAWAEGRLPVERALALTGERSVADLLVLCALCDVRRPLLTGPPAPDAYPPDAIRHLAVIEPTRRRPAGVEDVPARLTSPYSIMSAYARGEISGLDAVRMLHLESLDALHDAMRDVGQHAMPPFTREALYPVEDGPGSGRRVELTVRVLIDTERSTVIVADPVTGRALESEFVQHGGEAGAAAAAVYAALKKANARL